MAERDDSIHMAAIQNKQAATTSISGGEAVVSAGSETVAVGQERISKGQQEVATNRAKVAEHTAIVDEQTRRKLNEIIEGVDEIKAGMRHDGPGRRGGPIEDALADGLAAVTSCDAADSCARAAEKIREFVRDNQSSVRDEDIAEAIRSIPRDGIRDASSYADAVFRVVASVVLDPGRNLPHRMGALEEARRIIAAAGSCASDSPPAPGHGGCAPGAASSEVLRDVSHLTTLLLGSSPAFADAMRMQSDALAYSLAAFNKVGDMQRQDALGLAITARAAADEFNRR
ncbi:MAG: hypothetical protein AB1Z98_17130 [Nannocystaceae bacterium]